MNKNDFNVIKTSSLALFIILFTAAISPANSVGDGFSWPINCTPGINCDGTKTRIGFPDITSQGLSFSCGSPGYTGHLGTDILVSSVEQGVQVLAAADGVVRWLQDGLFDRCPNSSQWACDEQDKSEITVDGGGKASLGFNAGNYIVIEHIIEGKRYLTLYAHLRGGSLQVKNGQRIRRGDRLALVGSSGNSLTPHLHFGVMQQEGSVYRPVDPWKGECNSTSTGLWSSNPPFVTPEATASNQIINLKNINFLKAQHIGAHKNSSKN